MCPNCGDELIPYRTDQRVVGQRCIILAWSICPGCQHVGLQHWTVLKASAVRPRAQHGCAASTSPAPLWEQS